ncbi:peptidase [Haloarcula salina]|uniref:peptidase n=1 Tax=Haloarcula salina TaxID=1429914 RepID=UPI003C6FFCAF
MYALQANPPSIAVAVATAGVLLVVAFVLGLVGSAVARRLSNPVSKYRLLYGGVILPFALLAYVVVRSTGFGPALLGTALADGSTLLGALLTAFLELFAAGLVGLAAYAPTVRGVREARNIDLSTGRALARMTRWVLGVSVVAAAVLVPLERGSSTIVTMALLAVFVGGVQVAAPWMIPLLRTTRRPTDAAADRLDTLRERAALSVRDTRVLETESEETASATVRGPPGYRRLFVTSTFLEAFDDETATALLAIQAGRIRTRVLARTMGTVLAAVVPLFVLFEDVGPTLPLLGASVAAVLGGLWLTRRGVRAADDDAAERVGPDTVADALERYAAVHEMEPNRRRLSNPLSKTPALGDRIDRLRAQETAR